MTSNKLDVERLVEEKNPDIIKKHVSSVDTRRFWYATSNRDTLRIALEHPNIDPDEIVWVDRDTQMDSKRIKGTLKIFQIRGEPKLRDGETRYAVHSSTMPCACDTCLKGKFRQCKYLSGRGNIKSHFMTKIWPETETIS